MNACRHRRKGDGALVLQISLEVRQAGRFSNRAAELRRGIIAQIFVQHVVVAHRAQRVAQFAQLFALRGQFAAQTRAKQRRIFVAFKVLQRRAQATNRYAHVV